MASRLAKPLHLLCGRAMVLHVVDALAALAVTRVVVVVGHKASDVVAMLEAEAPKSLPIEFVEQAEQRGTGDAASVALTGFPSDYDEASDPDLLIVPGDAPLVRSRTLAHLVESHRASGAAATLLTARLSDPSGYGRVVRGRDDRVARIVEDMDATAEELAIEEIATSIYCFRHSLLAPALRRLTPDNARGEYYLTDVIAVLYRAGHLVTSLVVADPTEVAGVNDRAQLAAAEAVLRFRVNEAHLRRGVSMTDPEATYIDLGVEVAPDVTLLPGVVLSGATRVESGAIIGPSCRLVDTEVGAGARVSFTVAHSAVIGRGVEVGPFVELVPGTVVAESTRDHAPWT